MQDKPVIETAIPKRRYQIGDYGATLLGEIQSGDPRAFRYILAFVPMGPPAQSADGRYRLRLINEAMSEVMDSGDQWGDQDVFADQAVRLGSQALGLQREQVMRLL